MPKRILVLETGMGKTRGEDVLLQAIQDLGHFSQSAGGCRPRYVREVLVNWSPGIYKNFPRLANRCCQLNSAFPDRDSAHSFLFALAA